MRNRVLTAGVAPGSVPAVVEGVRGIAQLERAIASGTDLFPSGVPTSWLGQNFEVYGVPTGPASEVSFALRWHGARPALLWECTGEAVTLTSSGAAPGWSTTERTGEALWPAPAGASLITSHDEQASPIEPPADGISFN